jgi:hexosaminidase
VTINGKSTNEYITNQDILKGGQLNFTMSSASKVPEMMRPSEPWKYAMTMNPYLESGPRAFTDSCLVSLHSYTKGARILYTTDTLAPEGKWSLYQEPFLLRESATVFAKAFSDGAESSFTESVAFIRIPYKRTVEYVHPYSHLYTAGGLNGLVDGIRGEPEVFGSWQGFQGTDMQVVIDLGEVRDISGINTGFLQQYPSWIWLPVTVKYEISSDGKTYRAVHEQKSKDPDNAPGSFIRNIDSGSLKEKGRYVRVTAANRMVCPPWHPGAGNPCWIFVDEIEVR